MKIKQVKIEDLKFADYNPRVMPDSEMESLKKSIKQHGFVQPVLVNSNPERFNIIIGGHQRTTAAKSLGWKEVPVTYVHKTLAEEKALNLSLNRIDGKWEDKKLADIINDLKDDEMIGFTGFREDEQSKILDAFSDPLGGEEDEEEDLIPEEVKSVRGEVYELGPHRLICGDSTLPETYEKLLQGAKVDMVFTDPPYNVDYHSQGDNLKSGGKQKIENDNLSDEDFKKLIDNAFFNMLENARAGAVFYICSGWSSYPQFLKSMEKVGFRHSGVIIWVKNSGSLGFNDYKYKHEWIAKAKKGGEDKKKKAVGFIYGWKNGASHDFFGDKGEFDVWEMPKKAASKYLHPTEKPDWLVMKAIRNSTKRNNIVLDCFGGSGSTLAACEKTGRRAMLIEYDPKFCDVIRSRYERMTRNLVQK